MGAGRGPAIVPLVTPAPKATPPRMSAEFRSSVGARLALLSSRAREAVEAASVLAPHISADILAGVLDRSTTSARLALLDAVDAELLVERHGALAFRHDLIRDAVSETVPAPRRRNLRRRAAAMMTEQGVPAAQVAMLLLDTAGPGDRMAMDVLRRAAAELAATAPATAATLIRRALEISPPQDPDRASMVMECITLLFQAGRLAEARALADTGLDGLVDEDVEATFRLHLALVCAQFALTEVAAQCDRALELSGASPPVRLHLRIMRTFGALLEGDFAGAAAAVDDDLSAARAAGDRMAEVLALNNASTVAFHRQRYGEAVAQADGAAGLASTLGPGPHRLWPDIWTAWVRAAIGQTDEALAIVDAALATAQRESRDPDTRWWSMCRARVLLSAGRLADARAEAEAVLETVDTLGLGKPARNSSAYTLASVALRTGEPNALRTAASLADWMTSQDATTMKRSGAWTAALVADAEGDVDRAMDLLEETFAALGTPAPIFSTPQDACDVLVLMRMAIRAGRHDHAAGVMHEIRRRADLNPDLPLALEIARHAQGLLDCDGDAMRRSVTVIEVFPGPVARSQVLEDCAEILIDGHRAEAIAQLDQAVRWYDAAGARHDALRLERRLRDLGVRRLQSAPSGPAVVWASLTASELAVVRLVADGATDREAGEQLALSTQSISAHLRRALNKLEIDSRAELAASYSRHIAAAQ
ncbi:MAG: putative regulatory protein [Conexibacter sp.]|nr:putative regulatory protein [Conexibacter sp.]